MKKYLIVTNKIERVEPKLDPDEVVHFPGVYFFNNLKELESHINQHFPHGEYYEVYDCKTQKIDENIFVNWEYSSKKKCLIDIEIDWFGEKHPCFEN